MIAWAWKCTAVRRFVEVRLGRQKPKRMPSGWTCGDRCEWIKVRIVPARAEGRRE